MRGSVPQVGGVALAVLGVVQDGADGVENVPLVWRVQVKSTGCAFNRGYFAPSVGGKKFYKADDIDFLVAYIVPQDVWYVIPVNRITSTSTLSLYPSGCRKGGGRFECYREAWHLMAGQTPNAHPSIRPIGG
jgi:hypothetical protein